MPTPTTPFYPMTHDDALALIAALQTLEPGLVTTSQAGKLAPNAEAIEDGFIKLATSLNIGLMSKAFAAMLENPETIVFTEGKALTQNAGFHNSIYRGKYLGDSVTADQYAAISAGTFDGLFVGDYWTINGVNWRIAGFDYWLNTGDGDRCQTHHVVIVPDTCIATGVKMNNSNVTTGAYIGSDFYTGNNSNTGRATAQAAVKTAFGNAHILSHREYLMNAITNGYESGQSIYDVEIELMNELMVYGSNIFHNVINGTNLPSNYTMSKSQLPLFRHRHDLIGIGAAWWLRDVVSSTNFANVYSTGTAYNFNASNAYGIRPAFAIKA